MRLGGQTRRIQRLKRMIFEYIRKLSVAALCRLRGDELVPGDAPATERHRSPVVFAPSEDLFPDNPVAHLEVPEPSLTRLERGHVSRAELIADLDSLSANSLAGDGNIVESTFSKPELHAVLDRKDT